MAKHKILVIEDDEDICELVTYHLVREGYLVSSSTSGEAGLEQIKRNAPNLVLLDLMLPGMNGLDVCRILRADQRTSELPVIMLTAKGEDDDVVLGLKVGADDYITKPFSPKVLVERVRNILRRKGSVAHNKTDVITVRELTIHPGRHEVTINNKLITLTITEFRLLQLLAQRPGWVFTREQIVNAIRGDDYPATERSVDVQVVGLRRKLGAFGDNIETVRGVGYRFKE